METAPHPGIHRAGMPFTSVELQAMTSQGILRRILLDVYAESRLPDRPGIRAAAARMVLSDSLSLRGTLCGETAAWVHLGGAPPERVQLIATGSASRQTGSGGPWQIHQNALDPGDVQQAGQVRVTTAERTIADLFTGTGVTGSSRALDRLTMPWSDGAEALFHWPAVKAPLIERDEDIYAPTDRDKQAVLRRRELIGRLFQRTRAEPMDVAGIVIRSVSRGAWDARRQRQVEQLLGELRHQCVSRRLPTVR